MKKSTLLFLIGYLSIGFTWAVTYKTSRCLCQLDVFLNSVRHNLRVGNDYSPTPKPEQPITNEEQFESEDESFNQTTHEGNTTTTDYKNNSEVNEGPAVGPSGKRRKRETRAYNTSGCGNDTSTEKGVLVPVYEDTVSYDQTVRLSVCDGVYYNKNYTASYCNCTIRSTGKLSICFLNIKYSSEFDSASSNIYKTHINNLLPWMDGIFEVSAIKSEYVRTIPIGFTSFGDDALLQAHFSVSLNRRAASVVYEIDTGFRTKEILNGIIKINGVVYETDIENTKGCYKIIDTTPADEKPKPSLGYLRFIFLGVGVGLMVLILLFICCGRGDQFYVRFW